MAAQKSKWKPWHKWVLGITVGLIVLISLIPNDGSTNAPKASFVAANNDSINRVKRIENIFSAWGGEPKKLVSVIKESLNDPESFEMIDAKYWDRDSFLNIRVTYTAKNGFGGRIKQNVLAKTTLDGDVIKLSKQ